LETYVLAADATGEAYNRFVEKEPFNAWVEKALPSQRGSLPSLFPVDFSRAAMQVLFYL